MKTDTYKVLIVDDVDENLQVIGNIIGEKNIIISLAKSGKQALKIAQKKLPDLILLDINMPEMDGYETCEILKSKEQTKDIPVIFLSALNEKEDIVKGFKYGGVDYITKPFNKAELLSRVFTHINLKKSKDIITQQNKELEKYKNHLEVLVKEKTAKLIKSEKKFRNIFETSNDAIFITDLEGNYIEANKIKADLSGMSIEELLNSDFKKEHRENTDSSIEEYFKAVIKKGHKVFTGECTNKKGENINVEINGKLIIHEDKKAILHISRNITERKIMERKLLMATVETENNERKRFAKEIHDGLGAILSTVKLYISIIINGNQPQSSIEDMYNEMTKLVDNAIKSAKEIAVNIRPKDLTKLGLKITLENFIERINKINTVCINFDTTEFNIKIKEDIEIVLFRIISELINNSLKYAEAKNVNIKLHNTDKDFILKYSDDGKGFDVDKIMNSNRPGIGLNNIISRAEIIGGKAILKSNLNNGMQAEVKIKSSLIKS